MNVNDLFPKKWLEPADLGGRSVSVKIVAVGLEEVYDPRSRDMHMKLAITFEKASKRMLLNKTQATAVAAATGSEETDDWIGKTIVLAAGQTQARRPTIVVAPPKAKASAPAAPTAPVAPAAPAAAAAPTDADPAEPPDLPAIADDDAETGADD